MSTRWMRLFGALFALALFASACGSDASETSATDETMSDETMSDETMSEDGEHSDGDDGHDHSSVIEVNPDAPVPVIDVALAQTDTPGLFAISVELTNFTITPENVDGDPVDNEGHMHLLIDGVKVERFTELEWQVQVPEGEHLVEVELNANNHSAYAVDGEPIRAGVIVEGYGEAEASNDSHDHEHSAAAPAIEDGLTAADATTTISAALVDGGVTVEGQDRIDVAVGDIVMIMVESDVAEEVHLHGYDVMATVGPGEAGMILFTADTAGKFEIEFESSGAFIAELVVS